MPWIDVIDGTGGAGEVEDEIDFAGVEGLADVSIDKFETRVVFQVSEIGLAAGEQIVDGDHGPALGEQSIAEMGSEKTGATGHQRACGTHAWLRPFLAVPLENAGWECRRDGRQRVPRCSR